MAQQVLKHLIPGQERRITMESIVARGGREVPAAAAQLKQKTNAQKIAYPAADRHVPDQGADAASLPEIGRGSAASITPRCCTRSENRQAAPEGPDLNRLIHK
jgi:hypothetical protein